MSTRPFTIEEVSEPSQIARSQARDQCHRRNSEWLQAHWADVLPHARGMFLAVASQESFIAKTAAQAWAWVEATHPDDTGAFVHYIRPETGPRIYADSR